MSAKISSRYKLSGGTNYKHKCSECGLCMWFKRGSRKFYKCLKYGDGGKEDYSSDWNGEWVACKDFVERAVPDAKPKSEDIEGQMNLSDFMS